MSNTEPTAESNSTAPASTNQTSSSSTLLWLGALIAVLVIPVFFLQVFWANKLFMPWYVPIAGTVAALLVIYATARQRRWWAVVIAVFCVALAGLEWSFVAAITRLPEYTGPVAVGSMLPAFHARLAKGDAIDQSYFQQHRPTALVFFQGRWCPFCMTQLRDLEAHHADFERIGAEVVVVSVDDQETAAQTQSDFPHLVVASDESRELANAVDLINKGFAPDGGDTAAPTILLLDGDGKVQWLHRPTRFIARPSATELVAKITAGQ